MKWNTWFVSDDGSDRNDCNTETRLCKKLQTVLNRAADGADIYVVSKTLSSDDIHSNVWLESDPRFGSQDGRLMDCCKINSSLSYSLKGFNGTQFKVTCSGQ